MFNFFVSVWLIGWVKNFFRTFFFGGGRRVCLPGGWVCPWSLNFSTGGGGIRGGDGDGGGDDYGDGDGFQFN